MDAEGQDDPLSQSPLTGIGLDAEDPCDEVPGLSPNVGEEPRLVLQDQLTDSLDLQLSPEPMSLKLGEKHDIDEVATPGFSTGETPSLGSQVVVATIKTPGSPGQGKKSRISHIPKVHNLIMFKLCTFNVNNSRLLSGIVDFIISENPDIVAIPASSPGN